MEEEAQVRAPVFHDVAVVVAVFEVHLQEGPAEHGARARHTAVEDVEAHVRLVPLVDPLKVIHVLAGSGRVFLHPGHHDAEGGVLVLDELLVLPESLVDLVDLDLPQTLVVHLRDGLHLLV